MSGGVAVLAIAAVLLAVSIDRVSPPPGHTASTSSGEPGESITVGTPDGGLVRPDEAVIVSLLADGRPGTLVVEVVGLDGPRRVVARLPAFGILVDETWLPVPGIAPLAGGDGYLAVLMESMDAPNSTQIWLIDLRVSGRAPARVEGGENGWGWGPGGRLAVLGPGPTVLRVIDSADGSSSEVPTPPGLDVSAYAAADGSGWYAGPRVTAGRSWTPTGVLASDGTFRAGPLPPPYPGVPRVWDADGAVVDAVPDDGNGRRRVFTRDRDGAERDWYRFAVPDARAFGGGDVRWTAARTGLWVLDQVQGAYRMVRVERPGDAPTVAARLPYSSDPGLEVTAGIAGLSEDDAVAVIQRFHGDQPAVTLVDLRTGRFRDVESPPAAVSSEFAGWAGSPP